jgi:uncharacterized membrane protein YedE/YeeE
MHFGPWLSALAGGVLIGLSAASLFLFEGRIAGISGMLSSTLAGDPDGREVRLSFLAGLIGGGLVALALWPSAFGAPMLRSPAALLASGLAVGFGTGLGGGCTSGHGVCGIGRLSTRSIVATTTFMITGGVAALSVRLLGGAS